MSSRGGRSSVGIAIGIAAALALALWMLGRDGPVDEPVTEPRVVEHPPFDAGRTAGVPPKPLHDDLEDPWAHHQPPPDYAGEPSDAGVAARAQGRRPEVEPMSDDELAHRRRESVDLITTTVQELDGEIAHAEANGRDDLASILRHRREQLVARRDQLERLLSE